MTKIIEALTTLIVAADGGIKSVDVTPALMVRIQREAAQYDLKIDPKLSGSEVKIMGVPIVPRYG